MLDGTAGLICLQAQIRVISTRLVPLAREGLELCAFAEQGGVLGDVVDQPGPGPQHGLLLHIDDRLAALILVDGQQLEGLEDVDDLFSRRNSGRRGARADASGWSHRR